MLTFYSEKRIYFCKIATTYLLWPVTSNHTKLYYFKRFLAEKQAKCMNVYEKSIEVSNDS